MEAIANNYSTLRNDALSMDFNSVSDGKKINSQSNLHDEQEGARFEDDTLASSEAFRPFHAPGESVPRMERIRYFVCWPLLLTLHFTVPDSRKRNSHRWFVATFLMSLVWLSLFSYVMLWMITVIGKIQRYNLCHFLP